MYGRTFQAEETASALSPRWEGLLETWLFGEGRVAGGRVRRSFIRDEDRGLAFQLREEH